MSNRTSNTRRFPREVTRNIRRLELAILESENHTRATLYDCRRRIVGIVRDLLPQAASLARKGRPRLLAICQKVLAEQSKPTPQKETTVRIRR